MEFRESETVELKREYTEKIRKEIIAFANSSGGTIYIGVDDDGIPLGVENPDTLTQRITNMIRDSVKPDITMFIHYETLDMQGKQIVAVSVQRGTGRPYYWSAKGIQPDGVYVRQGTSSVPATETAIRWMIKETDGDSYEEMRSLNQMLTFSQAELEFQKRGIEFGIPQMKTLGIISTDGVYSNLGLLLSDQCPHIIKAAAFSGTDQEKFQDRRQFEGSLLKQINDAYAYLDMHNQNSASFSGLLRVDQRSYPESALREALLNAVVHRDYSFSASTLLSVYTDRVEIVSVGGLVNGISLEDVMMGLSVCRNPKLANVFYRLNLIEAYGTGMKKIHSAYSTTHAVPQIQTTTNAFKVVLPNLNTTGHISEIPLPNDSIEDMVLNKISANGTITRAEIEQLFGISMTSANRMLKKLIAEQKIQVIGKGRNTCYAIIAHDA